MKSPVKSRSIYIKRVLFFLIFSPPIFLANAQDPSIEYKEVEMEMDGKLLEDVWNDVPVYTGFHNYLPTDNGLAENQTQVRVFHNGKNLYVGATYLDSVPNTQIGSLKRDDLSKSVAASDGFVLILDTQNQQQSAYYFAVNIGATLTDGLIERTVDGFDINRSWNTTWVAQTSVSGNLKHYELEIPLKGLNYTHASPSFGLQFYVRDIKNNSWTIYTDVSRNYRLFDLRFTETFSVANLPQESPSKFTITPAITLNYVDNLAKTDGELTFKPSLDAQYNLTSSLKLDATINPDFSQIDVDQQVTNLTRFAVFFPERRNFFLENADLFSNLGVSGVNPFYSRRVGASTDLQFGLKLSGNLSTNTRIGILNVQTEEKDALASQNYSALVGEQQLSANSTATGFLINRQNTHEFSLGSDYNRVTGVNLNYRSTNNRWVALGNFGTSFSDNTSGDNQFYHGGIWYNKRGVDWNLALTKVGKNYVTDVGFTPRLYNYDAVNQQTIREGYMQTTGSIRMTSFPKESNNINSYRYLFARNNTYWDENGEINHSASFYNTALIFKDLSAMYINLYHDYVHLKYGFDPLGNGNAIIPDSYQFFRARLGYNSVYNKKIVYRGYAQHGEYYNGTNTTAFGSFNYRLLPYGNLETSYEINALDLNELGKKTFHLARLTTEVFFSNRLNWTTYLQYNTQFDSFNVNSRLQWEYKPLSYVYFVVTDNLTNDLTRTNWGVAFKMNYRFGL